jgi:hypothetical protein
MSRPVLTLDHLALAAALSWREEEGVPAVDWKRPLGNSGHTRIALDVAEVLDWPRPDGAEDPPDELVDRAHERLSELAYLMPEILSLALEGFAARQRQEAT